MKRKEILKRAIALTGCMVMCVTSMPVSLFAGQVEETVAETSPDGDSSTDNGAEPGGNSSESGSTQPGENGDGSEDTVPDGTDSGSGDTVPDGSDGGSGGESGDTVPGGNGGESGDIAPDEDGSGSGNTDVAGPDGNSGEHSGEHGQGGSSSGEGDTVTDGNTGEQPQDKEENKDDETSADPSEPSRTTALDWTNNMDVLGVSLNQIFWESEDGSGSCPRNAQGQWDLTSLYEGAAETVTLSYSVSMTNDSKEPLLAGDTFSIALPAGLFVIQPDSGNLNPESETPEAGYSTSSSSVQVTLTNAVEREGFGGFQAALTVKAAPLPYEPGETERIENVVMQSMTDDSGNAVRENKEEFFLPAKTAEEPGKDDTAQDKPDDKPDRETPEDGKEPEDGKTDEKLDEETPEDEKTDEKPEGETPETEFRDLSDAISVYLTETELEVGADYYVELPITYTIPKATEIQPEDSFSLKIDGISLSDAAATAATAVEEASPMMLTLNAADVPQDESAEPGTGAGTTEEPGINTETPKTPEIPVTPETPEEPVTPETPEEPGTPEEPENPGIETPGNSNNGNGDVNAPESGGDAQPELPQKTEISVAEPVITENQVTTIFTEQGKAAAPLQGTIQLRGTVTEEDVKKGEVTFSIGGIAYAMALLAPKADENNTTVSFTKEWIGASPKGEEGWPDLLETGMLQIYYKLGENGRETEWKANDLGISEWKKGSNYSVDTSQGVGYQTYTLTVPKKYENEDVIYSFEENETAVRNQGYIPLGGKKISPGETFKNIEMVTYEAVLDIHDGDIHNSLDFFDEHLTLYQIIDGNETSIGTLDSLPTGITAAMNEGKLVISGLPKYTANQLELSYYIKSEPEIPYNAPSGDKYLPTYDNSASSNFGSVTNACHNGGTLTLLLTGETEYIGHKAWIDDNSDITIAARPAGTMYLWRYSGKSADYKTASQVKSLTDETKNIEWELNTEDQTSDYEMKQLPKYDPDGYPYTYFMKEILKGTTKDGGPASNYEQKMGVVSEDMDGKVAVQDRYLGPEDSRPSGDFSVYYDGTISNRRTEKIPQKVTKKWDAASFQNQLENVTVTMGLEGRRKGAEPEAVWKSVGEDHNIDGFFAEQLTQTISTSVNKYDEMGCEMEFRWVEKDVQQELADGSNFDTKFKMVRDEAENKEIGTFQLKHGEEIVKYKSEYNPDVNVMTNSLEDTTDYTVEKIWKGFVGASDDGKIPPVEGATIVINLYQNDELYSTFIMDGTADEKPLPLMRDGSGIAGTGQEITPYIVKFDELPKYNPAGRKYIYVAEEEPYKDKDGNTWHTTYKYDVAARKAEITNEPTGEGKIIRIAKKWLDDSDVEHRVPVPVEVYERKGDTPDPENDPRVAEATLSAEDNWWKEVSIQEEVNADKCYIREVSTKGCSQDNIGEGQIYVEGQMAYTNHHMYQVTGGTERDKRGMLYITNRRIGIVNMQVTKKWIDGDGALKDRPQDLNLKLHCVEHTEAIDYSTNTINFGPGLDSLHIKTVGEDGKEKDGAAIQSVEYDAKKTQFTYHFNNLPKYDAEGKVVHYEITEEDTNGSLNKSEYVSSVTYDDYKVGDAQHTNDSQFVTVTNQKSKTKGIRFYKLWKDKYAFEEGKRPDIYLSLYQTNVKDDGTTEIIPVEGYRDYLWTRDVTDSDTKWTCDFGELPKYDDKGNVITYYARELTHVDADVLGYDTSDASVMDTKSIYKDEYLADAADTNITKEIIVDGTKLRVLEENGTFVNRLTGTIIIDGKKVWKNVPSGLPFDDFPGLKIQANRTITKPQSSPKSVFVDVQQLVKTMRPETGSLLIAPQDKTGETDKNLEEEVAHTTLTKENRVGNTNDFTFKMTVTGENDDEGNPVGDGGTPLPKYDKDGALYYYSVAETVLDNAENLKDTTYEGLPGEVNNFIITNTYSVADKNTGKLRVSKIWNGIEPDKLQDKTYQYPAADFTLYRQYVSNNSELNTDAGMTKPEQVGDIKRLESTAKEAVGIVEFDNLRVMAPNGKKYHYFVEETILNGYKTLYTESVGNESETRKSESKTLEKSGEQTGYSAEVVFTNTYTPDTEKITLTTAKEWGDNSNAFGTRPELNDFKGKYTIRRYAEAQTGSNGAPAIADEDITTMLQETSRNADYYFEWTNTDKDTWTLTISNLERYAPNSMPWKYKIVEEKVNGYDNSEQTIDSANGTLDGNGNITMPAWTNNGLASASIEKRWANDDYGLRPTSIDIELYAKRGTDGGWKVASTLLNEDNSSGVSLPEGLAADKLKCSISASDDWKHTFDNLPAYVKHEGNIVPYSYQVVETKIGDYAVNVDELSFGSGTATYPETGPYKITATVGGKTTTIKNEFGVNNKYLKITKTWTNDNNNKYSTRPVNENKWFADFALYQKIGNGDWEQLKNTSNKNIILRVTGDNADTSVTMKFGPFPKFDKEGREYSYAAAEIIPTQSKQDDRSSNYVKAESLIIDGVESKDTLPEAGSNTTNVDIVTGTSENADSSYDTTLNTTNTLQTTELTVTKIWEDDSTPAFRPDKLTFVLQRKIKGASDDSWEDVSQYEQDNIQWEKDAEENSWTATFKNLPAYNPKGKAYVYRAVETQILNYQSPESTETQEDDSLATPQTMRITNKISEFEISKVLTGGRENEAFPLGAKLEIYDASGDADSGDAVATWECAGDGNNSANVITKVYKGQADPIWTETASISAAPAKGVIKGLDAGTYILRETKAPAGYETAADIPFTLRADGKTITSSVANIVSDDSNGIFCITMTDQKAAVKITKVDLEGNGLNDAVFTVTGTFANKESMQVLSPVDANAAGYLISSDALKPEHTYTLTEATAPDGYIKGTPITFWVDNDGKVHITNNSNLSDNQPIATVKDGISDTIIYRNAPIQISLEKYGKGGEPTGSLAGAVFTLTDKGTGGNGTDVLSDAVQSSNAKIILEGLIQGHHYTLTETKAPDGYILPSKENDRTYSFKVSDSGIVEELHGLDGFCKLDDEDTLIKIYNNPIKINLVKTDKTSKTGIENTSFKLHDISSTESGEDKTVTTDSNGELTLDGPNHGLIQGHTYTLTETPAAGYDREENQLTIAFKAEGDGTITISSVSNGHGEEVPDCVIGVPEGNISTINVKNVRQQGTVEILKVDAQNEGGKWKPLQGAIFELLKKDSQDSQNYVSTGKKCTTGEDGKANLQGLEWGDYKIKEVTPPAGYALSDTEFKFTISATSLHASYTDAAGNSAFKNEKTNVQICKKAEEDDSDSSLDGARFAVYEFDKENNKITGNPIWQTQGDYAPGTTQLSGILSVDTYYAIVEASAPEGYEKLENYVVIKLNKKGACEYFDNSGETRWTVNPPISKSAMQRSVALVTITATDTLLNVDLYKVADGKAQDDKTFLEGAELTVTGVFKASAEPKLMAQSKASANPDINAITINAENFDKKPLKGKLLAGEAYTITETTAPTGYTRFTGTITFKLNGYGEISECKMTQNGETIDYSEEKYSAKAIWIHDTPLETANVHPQICKVDDAGKPIQNISFILKGTLEGLPTEQKLTSDENGNLLTDELLAKMHVGETYTLEETDTESSPYEKLTEAIQFQIEDNGTIKLVQNTHKTAKTVGNILEIENIRTSFHISKVDENNKALSGAELTIYTNHFENGEDQPKDSAKDLEGIKLQWTTTEQPKTVIGLAAGTYWLVETKTPDGYLTADPVKFVLKADGTISSDESSAVIAEDGLSITMKDKEVRGHVMLTKKETGTETGINGAEFTLYKLTNESKTPNPDEDLKIAEKLTTADAAVSPGTEQRLLPDLSTSGIWSSQNSEKTNNDTNKPLKEGLRAGTYYFVETKAPDHYQLDRTPSKIFTIKGDETETTLSDSVSATVVTNPADTAEVEIDNSLISSQEHQRFLTIYKEDAENQEALSDAVLTLKRVKDMDGNDLENPEPVIVNGTEKVNTVIGADGKASITFGPLTDKGTYRLTEIIAPDGYALERTTREYDVRVTDHKAGDLEPWEGKVSDGEIQLFLLEKDTQNPVKDNILKNQRLTGSVSLKKVDEDGKTGLNGVAFKLLYQAEGAADFQEIKNSFLTGKSYSLKDGTTWNTEIAQSDVKVEPFEESEAGRLKISNLAWGTYRLQETGQLPGYINKSEIFEFKIGEKQAPANVGQEPANRNQATASGPHHILNVTTGYGTDGQPTWEESTKDHTLSITNEKTRVSFTKRMKGENGELPGMTGAEFTLQGKFADNPDKDAEKKFTTGLTKGFPADGVPEENPEANPTVLFTGILIAGEKYTLTEMKAPEGAVPANSFQVTFTMNEDGTLSGLDASQPENANADAEATFTPASGSNPAEITVSDAPVTMKVFKMGTDTAGSEPGSDILLEECTFEVTGRFAPDRGLYQKPQKAIRLAGGRAASSTLGNRAGKETITVTTTGNDHEEAYNALSGRLIIGETYNIKEITPPDGYAVGMDVNFTIKESTDDTGKATTKIELDSPDNNYEITQDKDGNPVITQRDNPVGLKLHKIGSNRPEGLNGAKFTLTGVKLVNGNQIGELEPQELESSTEEGAAKEKDGWIDLTGKVNETNKVGDVTTEYRYTFKETQAPASYSRAEEFTFRLVSVQGEGDKIPESRFELLDKNGNPVSYGIDGKYPAPYAYLTRTAQTVSLNHKSVEIDVISITNQYNPPVYVDSHTVEKIWDDKDNEAGKRPGSIQVKLLDEKNQEVSYAPVATLDESNGWKHTWYGLSKYNSYHAVEATDLKDTGYTAVMDTQGNRTVITNTYKAAEPSPTPTPEITPTGKPEQSVTPTPTQKPAKPTATPKPTKKPEKPTDTPKPSGTPGAAATPTPTTAPGSSGGNGSGGNGNGGSAGDHYGTDSGGATTQKTPTKTGDETNTMLYLFLLLVSGAVITGFRHKTRRNEGK